MSIPNVDTFEHDISEEIKTKDATITDIASAGGTVENTPGPEARTSSLLLFIGSISIIAVVGSIIALFVIHTTNSTTSTLPTMTSANHDSGTALLSISPALYDAVGGDIGAVSKSDYGFTLKLLSYTNVYAYMLKNESAYANDLAKAVGSPQEVGTTSVPFVFSDVTLNNQNMRVGVSGSSTVVYAFININTLAISSTTEGILTLRGGILK